MWVPGKEGRIDMGRIHEGAKGTWEEGRVALGCKVRGRIHGLMGRGKFPGSARGKEGFMGWRMSEGIHGCMER